MWKCLKSVIALVLCLAATLAGAQRPYVPDELEPWREWVLHEKEYRLCPFLYNRMGSAAGDFLCAWPGTLAISADAGGGSFSMDWTVYAGEQWLALPGDVNYWPAELRVDGRAVSVVLHEGSPSLRLGPGRYSVSGRFRWEQRPQQLAIPRQSGLLELSVDGRRIARPERSDGGVWLGERPGQVAEQDAVRVQVYRLLSDDIPSRLTTWLRIEVAGSAREQQFGPALSQDWTPLSIESDLPARLEADGSLRLQLRPGHWDLRLLARAEGVLDTLAMPTAGANMPAEEVWSYQSNDGLRVTAVQGANPVDPVQLDVPGEWQQLPAFRLQQGDALMLEEKSRGRVAADNRLQLERKLWLDFNGDGYVYEDTVSGEMRSVWRLDMLAPYTLLNATEADENLLITRRANDAPSGIEVRQSDVDVQALGRLESRGEFPVAGWQTRFESMSIELNLPPGHRLLAAPGVDEAPASWASRWQLLDFFLVLIVTVGTAKVFGNAAAVAALLALVLSLHENGSAAWSWLNLLAAVALVRVAPAGRFMTAAKAYRSLSALLLLAVLLPFMVGQLRDAMYPQLEDRTGTYYDFEPAVTRETYPASAPVTADLALKMERGVASPSEVAEEIVVTGTRVTRSYSRYAENAIVQAGPGRPSWAWHRYRLDFSGPVDAGRTMRLIVIPDWLLSLWRLLAVLSIAAFASVFVFEFLGRNPRWRVPGGLRLGKVAPSISAMACAFLLAATDARAEVPSPEILKDLERRLLAPPDCAGSCAELAFADVRIAAASMSIELTVHALDELALPLPGSPNGWRAEQVSLNGAAVPVYRGDEGSLWIPVPDGQSTVRLQGALPPVASLEVPFPAAPRAIVSSGDGWLVAGIRDRRLESGSLQLTRVRQQGAAETGEAWEVTRLPVFVRIERQVEFDLDWRVRTTVFRVAPQQGAFTVDVPLLDGESIVSGDFRVSDGTVQVPVDSAAYIVSWNSTLPRQSPLQLTVAEGVPWAEVWQFTVGSVWHATFDGVPESEFGGHSYGVRTAWFHPRAAESLTVHAERPEGVEGNTLAFDAVQLETTLGARTRDTQLALEYRSTRGAQQQIRLPADAQVVSVEIDGRTEPLRADAGVLNIPILPGEHSVSVRWQTDAAMAFRELTPAVDLGAASGNITLSMEVPENRWILFAGGPDLGPAVLYWSELAALVLVALVLGRIDLTPLGSTQWILLGLGFSTFSWGAFAVVTLWLLAGGARHRWRVTRSSAWFNLQQLVFAFLSVAALTAIVTSLPVGLLGNPDMHITGNGSFGGSLDWFADRSDGVLPQASVLTAPLWLYKALILAWALWLSFALLRWLPWAWKAFAQEGLWRPRRKATRVEAGHHE